MGSAQEVAMLYLKGSQACATVLLLRITEGVDNIAHVWNNSDKETRNARRKREAIYINIERFLRKLFCRGRAKIIT